MADKREITCIACPMGCRLSVFRAEDGRVVVENYSCKRGITYGEQEFTCPMRTVTSSVRVSAGKHPLCSVKTKNVIPKAKIPEVLAIIRQTTVNAPISIGQVIVPDIAGTGVDLVATSACKA